LTEPTHGEILRAIGVLEGQLRQLLDAATAHREERNSLGERVGRLENRMAQVVILAVVVAAISPMIYSEISYMRHRSDQQGPALERGR
jgi:hypothetical protein